MKEPSTFFRVSAENTPRTSFRSAFSRIASYTAVRTILLALMVVIGVFLAIIMINYGGFVDQIFRSQIDSALMGMAMGMRDVPLEEKAQILDQAEQAMIVTYGLNEPFLVRAFLWLSRGLSLDWGNASRLETLDGTSKLVRRIILDRLPNTLLLAGSANLLLFFSSVFFALFISRRYGSLLDKIIVALSPISSAPNWIHGVILTVIFAAELRILPFGGMFDPQPPETKYGYILIVLKHMILPVLAIFLSTFFQNVYAWRTFFLLHTEDDYVEMAEAKGLPSRMIQQRYILRPGLPFIITSFALTMISFWQGAIALEVFFNWPGIGALFMQAIRLLDRAVVIGLVVIFAYLLAITIFMLDIIYALVDPRVKIGGSSQRMRISSIKKRLWRFWKREKQEASFHTEQLRTKSKQTLITRERRTLKDWLLSRWQSLSRQARSFRELFRYPSAVFGLVIVIAMLSVSVYAVFSIPYPEAIRLWRGDRNDWYQSPKNALPVWVNLFNNGALPRTIVLDSRKGTAQKETRALTDDLNEVVIDFLIDYPYTGFPQDLVIFLTARYDEKRPHISMTWLTPDGREINLADFSMLSYHTYYLSGDSRLQRRLKGQPPLEAIFSDPLAQAPISLKGTYRLRVSALVFEDRADVDAEMVLFGQVHGWAGTDHYRRDLMVALLWGAPVALAFGLLGALSTTLVTMIIAAVSAWFGGWVDDLIQRITEVNMILPSLPIAITVYYIYGKSIWLILGVIILLSIFGSAVKNFRAIFLQVKEAPYIEAARAYGASNLRIIMFYLVPRITPVLIPQLVILIPGYVFLEATLAFLGVSDPYLPTWGKVVYEALRSGAFQGHYYWVLEPIALLLLTGLSFAMLGFALDRIFNPRLREL